MSRPRSRLVAVDQGGSSATRPLWVCRHEAAHAVVAHVMGDWVHSLTVEPRRGGWTAHSPRSMHPDPLRQGMIAMAGHAADVLWSRRNPLHGPKDDDLALKQLGFRGPSFPTLLALAQGQCVEHENKIRAVAAALKKSDLDRRGFLKALRASAPAAPGLSSLEITAERAEKHNRKRGRR